MQTDTESKPRSAYLADGVIYLERTRRGERVAMPLGTAHISRPGRLTIELCRVPLGCHVLDFAEPLSLTIAIGPAEALAVSEREVRGSEFDVRGSGTAPREP